MSHDNTVPVYKALSLCYFREVCKTGWFLRAERGLQPHFTDEETEPQRGAAGVQVPRPGSSAGTKTVRKNGGGGTPGASTPRVLISGEVPAPGLLGSLESEPLPSIALRVPHPLGGREILLEWGVRSCGGHRTALQGT